MVDFTNLQVYGVPVVTYLLVGITTGVLAYATSIGGIEQVAEKAANSLGDVTGNPANVLSNTSSPEEPEEKEAPVEESAPPVEESDATEEQPNTGGKKHKKKTPKSKSKTKTKKNKSKKNTKRSHK